MPRRSVEVRYNDNRFRLFDAWDGREGHDVRTLVANRAQGEQSLISFAEQHGVRELVLTSSLVTGARETWHRALTRKQIRSKLLYWREKCEEELLTTVQTLWM